MNNLQKSLEVLTHVGDKLPSPLAAVETVTNALSEDTPENRENLAGLAAAATFGFVISRMKDKESFLTFLVAGGGALAAYYGTELILDAVYKAKENMENDTDEANYENAEPEGDDNNTSDDEDFDTQKNSK